MLLIKFWKWICLDWSNMYYLVLRRIWLPKLERKKALDNISYFEINFRTCSNDKCHRTRLLVDNDSWDELAKIRDPTIVRIFFKIDNGVSSNCIAQILLDVVLQFRRQYLNCEETFCRLNYESINLYLEWTHKWNFPRWIRSQYSKFHSVSISCNWDFYYWIMRKYTKFYFTVENEQTQQYSILRRLLIF